jgi:hypothetical protein
LFGFGDVWVALAYILCVVSSLFCVGYGILHWNDEEMPPPVHPPDENPDFEETE